MIQQKKKEWSAMAQKQGQWDFRQINWLKELQVKSRDGPRSSTSKLKPISHSKPIRSHDPARSKPNSKFNSHLQLKPNTSSFLRFVQPLESQRGISFSFSSCTTSSLSTSSCSPHMQSSRSSHFGIFIVSLKDALMHAQAPAFIFALMFLAWAFSSPKLFSSNRYVSCMIIA